jgi:O-antigen/teichoic acid export membrane protein
MGSPSQPLSGDGATRLDSLDGLPQPDPLSASGVGRQFVWGTADQILFSITSFALAVAVARVSTPSQFGAFGIVYVVYALLLGGIEAFTAEVHVVRASQLGPTEQRQFLAQATGTAAAVGLVIAVVGLVVSVPAPGPVSDLAPPLLVLAPALFVQNVFRFGFFSGHQPRKAFLNDLLWAICFALGLGALHLLHEHDPVSLLWAWSAAGAFCGAVAIAQARCTPDLTAFRRWVHHYGRDGGRYAGEYLALFGAGQGVLVCVGLLNGLQGSAGYRGAQLLFGPVQVVLNAVRLALTPLVVRGLDQHAPRTVRRGSAIVGFLGGGTALLWGVLMLALPTSAGRAVLGKSWLQTHPVILPMALMTVAVGIGSGALVLLRAVRATTGTFHIRVLAAALILVFGTLGAWTGGAREAAYGVMIGASLATIALWAAALRLLPLLASTTEPCPGEAQARPLRPVRTNQLHVRAARRAAGAFDEFLGPTQQSPRPTATAGGLAVPGSIPPAKAVPNVFVIGAMRAGTTTFCEDLAQHPAVTMGHHKEPWVLLRCKGDDDLAHSMYADLYFRSDRGTVRVDGSTGYAMAPEYDDVAPLAARVAPGAKIVYLVRNPVHRAISHYQHLLAWGVTEAKSFDDAIRDDRRLIDFGRYWWQLQPWLDAYGPDAVHVVVAEEYQRDRRGGLEQIRRQLGLADAPIDIDESVIFNESSRARALPRLLRIAATSELYLQWLRPALPERFHTRLRDSLLPRAPRLDVPPGADTVERIIEACATDAVEIARFIGRTDPLWDWDTTRAETA